MSVRILAIQALFMSAMSEICTGEVTYSAPVEKIRYTPIFVLFGTFSVATAGRGMIKI